MLLKPEQTSNDVPKQLLEKKKKKKPLMDFVYSNSREMGSIALAKGIRSNIFGDCKIIRVNGLK